LAESSCKRVYVYPDGSFTREAVGGLEPLAIFGLCDDGRLVVEANGSRREIDLSKCVSALRGLLGDSEGLIEHDRLFSSSEFDNLVGECDGVENLELALALFVAQYRLDYSKRVVDILFEG